MFFHHANMLVYVYTVFTNLPHLCSTVRLAVDTERFSHKKNPASVSRNHAAIHLQPRLETDTTGIMAPDKANAWQRLKTIAGRVKHFFQRKVGHRTHSTKLEGREYVEL